MTLFPFTVHADPSCDRSPYDFRKVFDEVRPKGRTWYAYDVEVRSPTRIEFIVFGMFDSLSGGIGDEIFRVEADVPEAVTRKAIDRQVLELARWRRMNEVAEQERREIERHAAAIREESGLPLPCTAAA